MIILKDKTKLENERVVAEIGCRDHRCAQPPGQPCIVARTGRVRQIHLVRKKDWVAANRHLVRALVPSRLTPRVARAVDYVLAQNDDWDVLFPPAANTVKTSVSIEDPGAAYADLLDVAAMTGGTT